jgi:YbbR domain-containing protein
MNWSQLIRFNLGWKVLSLVLATLIWFTVRSGNPAGWRGPGESTSDAMVLKRMPITLLTAPGDQRRFQVDPAEVTLLVRGDPNLLRQTERQDFEVYVNLVDVPEGETLRKRIQVNTPVGVTLHQVTPAFVDIRSSPH